MGLDGRLADDEARERLFEPFFTTKAKGIGLGLAVSRRIVESHGGDISVKTGPGAGTSFTLTIPTVGATAPALQ